MHRAAGLAFHRLGHEGRVEVVAQRGFAHRALEQESLVGEFQRVAVQQVDFHLPHAFLVDQRIDLETLAFAEVVHVVEHRVELVDRIDVEGLPAEFGAPGAADRRLQRHLRIDVGLQQVEFELGGDHRLPAFLAVAIEHPAQTRCAARTRPGSPCGS